MTKLRTGKTNREVYIRPGRPPLNPDGTVAGTTRGTVVPEGTAITGLYQLPGGTWKGWWGDSVVYLPEDAIDFKEEG